MKKVFTLLATTIFFSIIIKAQAPQGINYQAVAYDNTSQPVTNQTIGVRLSVLDGGASGTVLYSETQTPNTDNTGLFSIVIGNGNVVSGTFAGINWGNGTKWLKTEIDIAGGNNYVVMGSSQFMSVPYALYADKAGSVASSSFSYGSFTIPDGFENVTNIVIQNNTDYTVPAGKNLYIPSAENPLTIDGDTLFCSVLSGGADSRTFVGASENSVVNFKVRNGNILPSIGFLVDKKVQWKTFEVSASPFTVPAGKQFVIVNISAKYLTGGFITFPITYANPPSLPQCYFSLNGTPIYLWPNTILGPGAVVSATCTSTLGDQYFSINGYFMDR